MKTDCEVIRDLLPLYADNACSVKSCAMVEEHLQECPDCRELVSRLLISHSRMARLITINCSPFLLQRTFREVQSVLILRNV